VLSLHMQADAVSPTARLGTPNVTSRTSSQSVERSKQLCSSQTARLIPQSIGQRPNSRPAYLINAVGAENIPAACAKAAVPLLQLSTDYVFVGEISRPLREDDPVSPLSVYGRSHLRRSVSRLGFCTHRYSFFTISCAKRTCSSSGSCSIIILLCDATNRMRDRRTSDCMRDIAFW
jgi:hypothetical protein